MLDLFICVMDVVWGGGGGESGNYIFVVFVFSKVVNFCVISLYYF